MRAHFNMMAAYNKWANSRLFDAVDELSDSDYRRDLKAFFGSIHGTLNHLLACDQIWLHRFTGEGNPPKQLDPILHDDLHALKVARREWDDKIIEFVGSMQDEDYTREYTYRAITKPATVTTVYGPTVAHFFNHQTHHRGHVHAMLSQLGQDPPSLDLLYYHYEQEKIVG